MKIEKSKTAPALATGLFALALAPLTAPASITIETVQIGAIGNAPDGEAFGHSDANQVGKGQVDHAYAIGTTEVTTAQYAAFLNAVAKTDTYGLYSSYMSSDCGLTRSGSEGSWVYEASAPNYPVTDVTFWNALRFANWLTNGQPEGAQDGSTTEDGMYALNGHTGSDNIAVPRKLSGTGWALPSEDEWYKAAYYDTKGTETLDDDTYTLYATGDSISTSQANYYDGGYSYTDANGNHLAPVGTYAAAEQNGTFDMMGNVFEWTEGVVYDNYRGLRGGSFDSSNASLASSARNGDFPDSEFLNVGFRVSSLAVPEPSTYGLIGGGMLLGIMVLRRRKNRVTL